jgi:Ala-tRNA(Pro) deacylase
MPTKELKEFLDNHHVKYEAKLHSPAFTSQEVAAAAHVSGKQLAKVVMVKADGHLMMMVVAANNHVNFSKLREAAHVKKADLAAESEFKDKFPGCEVGTMPPFGNLYDMPVFISSDLTHQDHILFNAGSHSELVELAYNDFERLVHPKVVEL